MRLRNIGVCTDFPTQPFVRLTTLSREDDDGDVLQLRIFLQLGAHLKTVELNYLLNNALGKNIKPRYIKMPVKNYIDTQLGDISKISSALNYKPKYSLEKGVKYLVEN